MTPLGGVILSKAKDLALIFKKRFFAYAQNDENTQTKDQ